MTAQSVMVLFFAAQAIDTLRQKWYIHFIRFMEGLL